MLTRLAYSIVLIGTLTLSLNAQAPKWNETPPPKRDYAGRKSAPAPKHDLTGFWDGTAEGGIQPKGSLNFPDRGQQDVPYSAAGKTAQTLNKPGETEQPIATGEVNDPVDSCEPQGFPRADLHQLRVIEIAQAPNQVILAYQFYNNWRVIWTDDRELPDANVAIPRWNGYSVGKWVDDYTFVAHSNGTDERTWLDNAGRPHSDELQVEEQFHRVNFDTLQLTVTITDPKYYTKPWLALNKFTLHRLPDDFDMKEFICTVSDKKEFK
jgi:hypothetical protein